MRRVIKPIVFVAALTPAVQLVWRAIQDDLGANPIEAIMHGTGDWALRFLLMTLAVTPVRRLFGWNEVVRYRRMLGLFAFFYATLHFATWFVLDQYFAFDAILADIVRRPFITAGFVGFVLMLPLALTSTAGMIRRLGGRRWALLHRLVYASAIAGVLHYLWLVKVVTREPLTYAAILAGLLLFRVWWWVRRPRAMMAVGIPDRHTPLPE